MNPALWKAVASAASATVVDANDKILLSNIPRWLAEAIVCWRNAEDVQMTQHMHVRPFGRGWKALNRFKELLDPLGDPLPTPSAAINAAAAWLLEQEDGK